MMMKVNSLDMKQYFFSVVVIFVVALLDLQLMLNGQIYLNNSYISLEEINEDDRGLFCVTSYPNCCAGASRAGEFYYPNGNKVPILNRQDGFYRDRGDGYIRLNRLSGVLSPVGTFQCEIPNSAGVLLNISFTLTRKLTTNLLPVLKWFLLICVK